MEETTFDFERATDDDLKSIKKLLKKQGLPNEDIGSSPIKFWILKSGKDIVACAGLEVFGIDSLMRSVAVSPKKTGSGVGNAIVEHVIEEADEMGVNSIYLLTETAREFFKDKGFGKVHRGMIPATVKTSRVFTDFCDPDADAMVKRIKRV